MSDPTDDPSAPTSPPDYYSGEEYVERLAQAIYGASNRRKTSVRVTWQALPPPRQAAFLEMARYCAKTISLDALRRSRGSS